MKNLTAYSVQGDENGCVVFAASGVAARRMGANNLDCDFSDVTSCRRAPEFDQYANLGTVPVLALLKAGWWWSCQNCERRVSDDEYDDDDTPQAYVIHNERVYCCQACRDQEVAYWIMKVRREQALTDCVHEKWPGVTVRHVSEYRGDGQVSFTFPGGAHPANWHNKDNALYVSVIDHPAWAAFTGKPVEIMDRKAVR